MKTVSKVTVLRALVLARRNPTNETVALFKDVLSAYEKQPLTNLQRESAWMLYQIVTAWWFIQWRDGGELRRVKSESLMRAVLFL